MSEGKAIDALRTALEDVAKLSDHILNSFDQEMESFTNRQWVLYQNKKIVHFVNILPKLD